MKKHLILMGIILFLLSLTPVSAEETKNICKTGTNLVDCIKSQYTTQGSNGLYHHDGTLENGANDNSYRYAGGDYKVAEKYKFEFDNIIKTSVTYDNGFVYKVNLAYDSNNINYKNYKSALQSAVKAGYLEPNTIKNWVCFGTYEEICSEENMYRIIGAFDSKNLTTGNLETKIKLIKAHEGREISLGTSPFEVHVIGGYVYYKGILGLTPVYQWNRNGDNFWTTATLNINVLNDSYLNVLGENWSRKIALSEWELTGLSLDDGRTLPSECYQKEVVDSRLSNDSNSKNQAKVGLMYVSDYGFAASPENWTTKLSNYGNDTNRNNNWMHLGADELTITRRSDSTESVDIVAANGTLTSGKVLNERNNVARPTFYLNSDIAYVSGEGTETNPIRIASLDELPKEDPKPEKPDDKDNTETKPDESKPNDEFENPATGFFVPLVILTIGLAVGIVIIIKTIKNKKLFKL